MGIEERTQQIGIRPYQQKDKQAVAGHLHCNERPAG